MILLGMIAPGIEEVNRSVELFRRVGGNFALDLWLVEAAHALVACDQKQFIGHYIHQVEEHYKMGSERAAYAEFLRLKARLCLDQGDREEGYRLLREAIGLAEVQTANLFLLRACCDLAQLLVQDGDALEGRRILTPVTRGSRRVSTRRI